MKYNLQWLTDFEKPNSPAQTPKAQSTEAHTLNKSFKYQILLYFGLLTYKTKGNGVGQERVEGSAN